MQTNSEPRSGQDAPEAGPVTPTRPAPDGAADPSAAARRGARPVWRSLLRGWSRACPCCGGGPVFDGYLHVRERCMICGEELHHHRADDMPAWLTILVVGHATVPLLLLALEHWAPPLWVHMVLWPVFVLAASLLLLPRAKAMVVALQWATRMGGFGTDKAGREGA